MKELVEILGEISISTAPCIQTPGLLGGFGLMCLIKFPVFSAGLVVAAGFSYRANQRSLHELDDRLNKDFRVLVHDLGLLMEREKGKHHPVPK